MSGNPFKKGKDKQPLSGGVRSDEWDDDQEDEVPPPPLTRQAEGPAGYPPPAPFARPTEGPGPAGYPPLSTSASAGLATAGSGAPPPPGGGAPQPVAGVPAFPPPSAAAPPGAAAPDPYQIPAPAPSTAPYAYGSSGAWGGAPPVSGYPQQGVYGLSSDGPAGYAPQQGAAWTGGYATEQPLTYSTFEQQAGGPQVPMRCWGMGEQWLLFIVGILIWPLW